MNVLHLFAPGAMAGAETIVLHGVHALQRRQNTQLMIINETRCPQRQQPFLDAMTQLNIPHVSLPTRKPLDLRALNQLRRHLRRHHVDIIHAHGFKALTYAKLTRASHTKIVCTHHGETRHTTKATLYERLARALYNTIDAVVAVSAPTRAALLNEHPALDDHLTVIDNFIAPTRLRAIPREKEHHTMRVVFIGRLSEEKGAHHLLNALPLLHHRAEIHIIGDGPQREMLEAHPQAASVHMHGHIQDPMSHLLDADLLVMPSLREGMPLTAIEALCHGVPIVATRTGALPQLITHNRSGYLADAPTPEAIAQGLNAATHHHKMWRTNAQQHITQWRERFGVERWVTQTLDHYSSVLENS